MKVAIVVLLVSQLHNLQPLEVLTQSLVILVVCYLQIKICYGIFKEICPEVF